MSKEPNQNCETGECQVLEELCSNCEHDITIRAIDDLFRKDLVKALKQDYYRSSDLSPCVSPYDSLERAKKLIEILEQEEELDWDTYVWKQKEET